MCLVACGVAMLFLPGVVAQEGSGSRRASPPRATRPMTPDEFYAAFWKHIVRQESPYTKWGSLPGKEGLREGKTPHGDSVRAYANKTAIDNPGGLPYGTILVTENYGEDKQTLKDITVMYRVKGTDPQHGDWYWLKYLSDGSIARTPDKKPIAGKVASCIECHSKAAGKDLVFSNDPSEGANEK
jgi:hypothetical protein